MNPYIYRPYGNRRLSARVSAGAATFLGLLVGCRAPAPHCSPGMVGVPSDSPIQYCIDAYENIDTRLMNARAPTDSGKQSATSAPMRGVIPTTGVPWIMALKHCMNNNKHLCTVNEWQDACDGQIGPGGHTFPWGEFPASSENCGVPQGHFGSGSPGLEPTGSHPKCRTPSGIYDLVGNAWEWVDPRLNRADGSTITGKVGGAYYTGADRTNCRAEPDYSHPPWFEGTIVARCCAAPIQ